MRPWQILFQKPKDIFEKALTHRNDIKLSITNIAIRKSLNLFLIVLLTDIIHKGAIKVVKTIKRIDIPSIPTL